MGVVAHAGPGSPAGTLTRSGLLSAAEALLHVSFLSIVMVGPCVAPGSESLGLSHTMPIGNRPYQHELQD